MLRIQKFRGHPELNQGPLDLQSNALPLSYIPVGHSPKFYINILNSFISMEKLTDPMNPMVVEFTSWYEMEIEKERKQR